MESADQEHDDVTLDEMLPWLEFACWMGLALIPILYYINGPSISTDQAVVRAGWVITLCVGACVFRYVNWRRSR